MPAPPGRTLAALEGLENLRWWFDVDFRHDPVLLRARSPITGVASVQTPVLILQGADDEGQRCQSLEFYRALRTLGIAVEMVEYPHQGHVPNDPKMLIDLANREMSWINRYVLGESR